MPAARLPPDDPPPVAVQDGLTVGASVAAWAVISSSRCPDAPPAWNWAKVVRRTRQRSVRCRTLVSVRLRSAAELGGRRNADGPVAERQGNGRCVKVGQDREMPVGCSDPKAVVGFVDHLGAAGGQRVQLRAFLLGL